MAIETKAFECLQKSFEDVRCIRFITDLKEMLTRVDRNGRKFSRIFLDDGVTPLETVEDVLNALDKDKIEFITPTTRVVRHVNEAMSVRAVAKNILVTIDSERYGDHNLFVKVGSSGVFNLAFSMAYFNDNDKELPIKVLYAGVSEVER